ncbi:MAG: hypothetical protein ABSB56_00855 [Nitrososphaerales archaeon]|jgi:hypothetical protein
MSYRHASRPRYGRHGEAHKKNRDEKLLGALDAEWREFLAVRRRFREQEATAAELDEALEKLRRAQRKTGSRLLNQTTDWCRYPINWNG